ncbi:MAG: diiron oxygenase [Ilumatobacteraceae bacterium]
MSTTFALPRTAARSEQLTAASQRLTLDPFTDVDWERPIDDSAFHLPPEFLSLYGTDAWSAMSEAEQITYSRHEMAALCGAAIWFENALMQIVLGHLVHIDVKDPMHRYLLIEVADECRHSSMFGEYIRRGGTPAYGPTRPLALDQSAEGRALSYLLILAIEELLDYANRISMRDERVHATSRQIAKLHVMEEARHVSFAKTYLAEIWPALADAEREIVISAAPDLIGAIVSLSLDPAVFDELGIDNGFEIARANPNYCAHVVAGLGKLTTFLGGLGVIADRTRWVELGLVAT